MEKPKAITVNKLLSDLAILKQQGKGNYQIFLTDDEECNGYHACWYTVDPADEMDEDQLEMCNSINKDISILDDVKHAIYLG